jgi:hypothetical protein
MADKPQLGSGRTPPPVEHRFLKGQSGNKRGRPKGSVSLKKLTRKVALRRHRLGPEGPATPLLQLVLEALIRGAAAGIPSMVTLNNEIRAKICPEVDEKQRGGLLVVPAILSEAEFMEQMESITADAKDPSTYVNHKAQEFCKAAAGVPTPLGEAILASHKRWG